MATTKLSTSSTVLVLMSLTMITISPSKATNSMIKSQDLIVATEEMAMAEYFTFIMLINMLSPLDQKLEENITFLMPNDKMLSRITNISQENLSNLLLRHSIPSPMLFDHLEFIPSGSLIPSSENGYMFKVSNNGRTSFFLNNVKIIRPNICTAGFSIRCHGIDGVLSGNVDSTHCPNSNTTGGVGCSRGLRAPVVAPLTGPAPFVQGAPNQVPLPSAPSNDDRLTPSNSRSSGSDGYAMFCGNFYVMMIILVFGFETM